MSLKLGHYCLSVLDLKKSCDFYGLFGFVEKHRYNRPELGIDVDYLENPDGLMLELAASHSSVEAKNTRLSFREAYRTAATNTSVFPRRTSTMISIAFPKEG